MKLQFLGKNRQLADVWTFSFAPPAGTIWLAGQSIRLELPVGYDVEEKRFTISSAPFEKRIDITTRMSGSKFKNSLDGLKPGQGIDGQAIEGDFVWTEGAQSKLFVASGIGITPFISILKARQRDGGDLNLRLIYAGREVELPFEAWLKHLAAKQPQFKLSLIHGRRLQLQDLEAANRDLVYLSGPADMVNQLDEQLMAVGLPRQNLKRDLFTGSPGWSNY